jgi:hypothetical protein
MSTPKNLGRTVPKQPKEPINWKFWGIVAGILLVAVLAIGGLIYAARSRTPVPQPGIPKTMVEGESIEISKICEGVGMVIMPFQLASVDATGQALFFHPNMKSETVVESLKVGRHIIIETPCGRYAAGVVKAVKFYPSDSSRRSTVELEMFRTLVLTEERNPEQTAPSSTNGERTT